MSSTAKSLFMRSIPSEKACMFKSLTRFDDIKIHFYLEVKVRNVFCISVKQHAIYIEWLAQSSSYVSLTGVSWFKMVFTAKHWQT